MNHLGHAELKRHAFLGLDRAQLTGPPQAKPFADRLRLHRLAQEQIHAERRAFRADLRACKRREYHHRRMRSVLLVQAAEHAHAVHHRQHQFNDKYIRTQLIDCGKCLFTVFRNADQLKIVRTVQHRRHTRAKFGVVVCK